MRLLERIISTYAPFECLVCGTEGAPVCDGCWPDICEPRVSTCYQCYRLTSDFRVCKSCRTKSNLTHVWLAADYAGPVEQLIKGLKYQHRRAYAAALARLLHETLPYIDQPPLLCPAPTTTARKRQRGYDHAELVARELSRLRQWPLSNALRRLDQSHQVGATRRERLANPIQYRVVGEVRGKSVLLVDDVVTTGHTIEAAAAALRAAGAAHVSAVVAASRRRG